MPLTAAHLRELADRLDAEEEAERRKLEEAESSEERADIRERLEALERRNQELEDELAAAEEQGTGEAPPPAAGGDGGEGDPPAGKPKMRRGRKRGNVYQDRPGEPGYVYQGDDEADLVPVEQEEGAA